MFLRDRRWLNSDRPCLHLGHYFHVLRIISPKETTILPGRLLVKSRSIIMQESKLVQIIHVLLKATKTDHSRQESKSDPKIIPYPLSLKVLRDVTGARGTVTVNVMLIPVYQQRPELIFGGGRRFYHITLGKIRIRTSHFRQSRDLKNDPTEYIAYKQPVTY